MEQQKTTNNTSFKLSNISFKHWFCWSIRFLPATRPFFLTFTRHAEGTITEPSLSRSFKALLASDRGLANQQWVGRCSSYLPPNHPRLVYLIYIYGWFFILTTVGWFFPNTPKRWTKNPSSGYQDTIPTTLECFEKSTLPETNEMLAPERNGIPQKNYI